MLIMNYFLPPIHPGQILWNDFLGRSESMIGWLVEASGISPEEIDRIIKGSKPVGIDEARRLAGAFPRASAEFWLGLQSQFDRAHREERPA